MEKRTMMPHTWMYKDPLEHAIHRAYGRAKAQANFRKQGWDLPLEHYMQTWKPHWHLRGRGGNDLVSYRPDVTQPWSVDNFAIGSRFELNIILGASRREKH
jgi:hypothetical protein